ncbi:UDP-4-amino-4,6-dideoxy-N-acetyl-beta-L-altrosamine transaminase [Rhizobium sp. EC-SD404]|uniref:UDP-4-amino-4, 6-dideoxy-N-acetyl-beta-L-altrosamine transaminase n=1 Tax=Rhizobium sp. EC-SD404 TaxID=2038389 RepID=UPI00125B4807|nr:UDP-4-amino-4,6-dideoxy-N-acetyl-beta-L-altrosamine transaminase [Rhizobium sp. EC-SD404]VVT32208.1 UDP-4-amino-4, 6-dideoxy-N-acetyl-beta-L-altrosamine transaminase [Rhizobium sp. EC-SD404]
MPFVPYGRQSIDDADVAAVLAVLRSDHLTQGPVVDAFERALGETVGARHCVAVNSATAALHIACLALGVGPGDLVWTSPISFVASANCALYCGAEIDFVDIDPVTLNMSVDALQEKLRSAEAAGQLPKVVIPVHLCGLPCDMPAIGALARRYGFKVIEDASHAIGARDGSDLVGACTHSDIAVFSFHPVKIITTGEGGCCITQDADLGKALLRLRSHGITRDENDMSGLSDGPWYYEQIDLGFNYRMTELQAALGLSQLRRLNDFIAHRHRLADRYDEDLRALAVDLPRRPADSLSSLHLYVVQLRLDEIALSHRQVFEGLRQRDIGVNLHYIPIYRQPYYRALGFRPGHCPNAEAYYARAISIPIFHGMTEPQQDQVVAALKEVLR